MHLSKNPRLHSRPSGSPRVRLKSLQHSPRHPSAKGGKEKERGQEMGKRRRKMDKGMGGEGKGKRKRK